MAGEEVNVKAFAKQTGFTEGEVLAMKWSDFLFIVSFFQLELFFEIDGRKVPYPVPDVWGEK
jgi:hypothetical protein